MGDIEPIVTAYQVCVLPEDEAGNYLTYAISVERAHHTGRWAVRWMGRCLGADGEWDWEPQPSSREDDWLDAHRFDLGTALRLATEAAADITVNGRSVPDMLAWLKQRGLA